MKLLTLVFGISMVLIVVTGCTITTRIQLVTPDEFETLMKTQDVFLLNTHTPYIGEINGTDLIIKDWKNISKYREQLPSNKNTPILVYCRTDSMSSSAAEQLVKLGYRNVYNLKGGMVEWEGEGKELVYKR